MASKTQDIDTFVFRSSDELLLDASFWMRVYGPSKPNDWRVKIYSRALQKMVQAKSCLYVDVLIVSEFINASARIQHRLLQPKVEFKAFRGSADFKSVGEAICDSVRRFLELCAKTESGFEATDLAAILSEYEKGAADFNDHMLGDLCKKRGWSFVTDDGDLQCTGISLITANRKLLK